MTTAEKKYTVITADIVDSRHLSTGILNTIPEKLAILNQDLKPLIPAALFSGDEIQMIFTGKIEFISVILKLGMIFQPMQLRAGVGHDVVDLPLPNLISEARGPAFIAARQALDKAKQQGYIAWVNSGELSDNHDLDHDDQLIRQVNAHFLTLSALTQRWNTKTWRRFSLYYRERSIQKVAIAEHVSPEAINKSLHTAGIRYVIQVLDLLNNFNGNKSTIRVE